MTIEKIDIMEGTVYCYGEKPSDKLSFPLDDSCNALIKVFSDTEELLTINISSPIKRIMKFYKITESVPESYKELPYSDMTFAKKKVLDSFIESVQIR